MFTASRPGRPAGQTARIIHRIFDGGRREARFVTTLAVLLVLVRAAAFVFWEGISFDSDQAIVGLMAKHLSEFRTFPVFYYGQNYMLGVQAWIIAPFFWIARPSVAVMRIPLVILNVVAAVLLMRGIGARLRLRPPIAFVAALPFIVPTPVVAGSFLQTLGSSGVEPLVYVLILWMLRARPFAFGALLAFGFLHREFTMYALPALVVTKFADGSWWTAETTKRATLAAAGFAFVWLVIDDLRLHLDGLSLTLQAQMLGKSACFAVDYMAGIRSVLVLGLPIMSGGRTMRLDSLGMRNSAVVGSGIIGWAVAGAMTLMLVRLAWLWRQRRGDDVSYGAYLAIIGCCALAAYPLGCSTTVGVVLVRYLNLALLLPVGCFALFMAREPSARLRSAVVVVFMLWGTANLVDNLRVIRQASVNPEPYGHRVLTDFLLSHQIRYARANYWDAYVVDFLSRERVIVGSSGPARIPEYERRVDEHSDTAVKIERTPCEGQLRVAAWCIQVPAHRPGEGAR